MSVINDLKQAILWAKDDITLSPDQANQVLDIIEAAREFCGGKADQIEASEDETLHALVDALREAGEDVGE